MAVVQGGRATHTTLEIVNVQASVRFYREVLGLRTLQPLPAVCYLAGTNGHQAAAIQLPKRAPQPLLNFYARPVPDAAAVDAVHARIDAVRDEYGIQELTVPAREDPTRFGVGTYGFYLKDCDANWWRIEENAGPFGPLEIPVAAEPRGSLVPAGPISYVTLESRDLAATARFCREFLGLTVEQPAPHYLLCPGHGGVNVLIVEVGDGVLEQTVLNHHGITLDADEATIDRLHARAEELQETYGLKRIMPVTHQHGSYSFYLQDRDTNWWELEIWERRENPWDVAERALTAQATATAAT